MGVCAEKTPCLPWGASHLEGSWSPPRLPTSSSLLLRLPPTSPPLPRPPHPPASGPRLAGALLRRPQTVFSWTSAPSFRLLDSSISHCPGMACSSVNHLPALTGSLEPGEGGQVDKVAPGRQRVWVSVPSWGRTRSCQPRWLLCPMRRT